MKGGGLSHQPCRAEQQPDCRWSFCKAPGSAEDSQRPRSGSPKEALARPPAEPGQKRRARPKQGPRQLSWAPAGPAGPHPAGSPIPGRPRSTRPPGSFPGGQGIKGRPGAGSAALAASLPSAPRAAHTAARHGALDRRGEERHHRRLEQGGRAPGRRRVPLQAADSLPLDPALLHQLRQPEQRGGHPEQCAGQGPRQEGLHRLRGRRQEPRGRQGHLRQAERAALRQAARRPRQLQAAGRHPDHSAGSPLREGIHSAGPGLLPEAGVCGGPRLGPPVPLGLLRSGCARPSCPSRGPLQPLDLLRQ